MSTLLIPRSKLCTFDDFCAIVGDGKKADLIDGVIYMASPDNTCANELNGWLFFLLSGFVQRKKRGKVYVSRVAFRLDKYNGPEPDIGFVKRSSLRRIRYGHVLGGPDLAVEIVSPDSIDRDYAKKRDLYERSGVGEYWIVDELFQKITVLRLGKDGRFEEVAPEEGVFRSKVVKGFWLREEWLWMSPLPDALETLNLLLQV